MVQRETRRIWLVLAVLLALALGGVHDAIDGPGVGPEHHAVEALEIARQQQAVPSPTARPAPPSSTRPDERRADGGSTVHLRVVAVGPAGPEPSTGPPPRRGPPRRA